MTHKLKTWVKQDSIENPMVAVELLHPLGHKLADYDAQYTRESMTYALIWGQHWMDVNVRFRESAPEDDPTFFRLDVTHVLRLMRRARFLTVDEYILAEKQTSGEHHSEVLAEDVHSREKRR